MKTTFSRRQLYALGEPFGDSATVKKVDGGRIYGLGGGGGPTQTTSTSYQTNIPEYARPYVDTMLGATQNQLFTTKQGPETTDPSTGMTMPGKTEITGFQPYRAYGGTYDASGQQLTYDPGKAVAGFQPMQETAQRGIAGLQTPGQYETATQATAAGIQNAFSAGQQYQPQYFGNQFQAPGQYQPGQFGMMQAQAPELQQYQMGPAERASTQSFTQPGSAEAYMNPFMQSVVDKQTREAERQAGLAAQQQRAQSIQRGSFGGGRTAIREAAAARDLAQLKSDIYGTGQQAAFQNAQQQFNAEQQARMQAQLANQQAGLTVGGQNLAAQLGIQQLGAGQDLQAQLANQQAFQQAQAQREASRQFGYGQQMNAAQQRAQYGLAANQLNAQQQQFGANLGLQGTQAAMQGAGQLAGIGGQQLQAQQGILGLQNQVGAQQQQLEQQKINQAMQDYANAQQYPLMQLGFMSNMLRGLPMQSVATQQYVAQPNAATQAIGALGTGASIYNAFKAKGGVIKEMAEGGIASVPRYDVGGEVYSDLLEMNVEQLKNTIRGSSSQRVKEMAKGILAEKMTQRMYGGGIVAFQTGGDISPSKENLTQVSPIEKLAQDMAARNQYWDERARERDMAVIAGIRRDIDELPDIADNKGRFSYEARSELGRNIIEGLLARRYNREGVAPISTEPVDVAPFAPTAPLAAGSQTAPATDSNAGITSVAQPAYSGDPDFQFLASGAAGPQTAPATSSNAGIVGAVSKPSAPPARGASSDGSAGEAAAQASQAAAQASKAAIRELAQPSSGDQRAAGSAIANSTTIPAELKGIYSEALKEADKPVSQLIAERKQMLKDAGVVDVAQGRATQRSNLMAERANAEDEAKRQRHLRLAQIFAKWGSTPGSTLVAGLNAFKENVENIITDEKELKKFKRDLDKSIADLDQADRLEKIGEVDAAMKIKMDAKNKVERLNEKVFDYQQQQLREDRQTQRDREKSKAEAERQEAHDLRDRETRLQVTELDRKLQAQIKQIEAAAQSGRRNETLYTNAVGLQANVEAKIGNLMKSPQYVEAERFANMDPEGKSEDVKKRIAASRKTIETANANFDRMRNDVLEAVERARARLEGEPYKPPKAGPKEGPASGDRAPLPSFERGSSSAASNPEVNAELKQAQDQLVAATKSGDSEAAAIYAKKVADLKRKLDAAGK